MKFLTFMLLFAPLAQAEYKMNPYTNQRDYYESTSGLNLSTQAMSIAYAKLSSTQTFTGKNTFTKQVTISTGLAVSGGVDFTGTVSTFTGTAITLTSVSKSTPTLKNTLYVDNLVGAWAAMDGTGTPSISQSFNFESPVVDSGVGDYILNFSNHFLSAAVCFCATGRSEVDDQGDCVADGSTNSVTIGTFDNGVNRKDRAKITIVCFGMQ